MAGNRSFAAAMVALLALAMPCAPALGASTAAGSTLPKRTVTSAVTTTHHRLVLKGKVSPGHAKRAVFVQKKTCRSCDWKQVDKVRTSDTSRYRVRIYAPATGAWFWRVKVRAYGGYGTSYSKVWKTYLA